MARKKTTAKRATKRAVKAAATRRTAAELELRDGPTREKVSYFPVRLASGGDRLTLAAGRLRVSFAKALDEDVLDGFLKEHALVLDDGALGDRPAPNSVRNGDRVLWVRTRDGAPFGEKRVVAITEDKAVDSVSPVYLLGGFKDSRGLVAVLPRHLAILRSARIDRATELMLRKLGLRPSKGGRIASSSIRLYDAPDAVEGASYRIAATVTEELTQLRGVVHLEYTPMINPFAGLGAVDPPDSLYYTTGDDAELPTQPWAMKRMGARYAWDVTTGAGASVFLFDEGILASHPDLASWGGIELFGGGVGETPPAPDTPHGTRMAGLIAAIHDVGGISSGGIAGWAPAATCASLRFDSGGGTPYEITNLTIQFAIEYARGQTRPVLCMGMEAGNGVFRNSTVTGALTAALSDALLVVVASGNTTAPGDPISYLGGSGPATMPANLLIVGGSDPVGHTPPRQGDALPDLGAGLEGSRVGTTAGGAQELSCVAPAERITVTDVTASGAVLDTPGYTVERGTSYAAAHVAGLATLVRAQHTSLTTGASVKSQILETCAKIGTDRTVAGPGPAYVAPSPSDNRLYNVDTATSTSSLGFGRADAAAVFCGTAAGTDNSVPGILGNPVVAGETRAVLQIRDNQDQTSTGDEGQEPSAGGLVHQSDIFISTSLNVLSATDATVGVMDASDPRNTAFDAAVVLSTSSQIQGGAENYLYVRVHNLGPCEARGVRVTALLAACSTGFVYPAAWDRETASGGDAVVGLNGAPPDDSYADVLPVYDIAAGTGSVLIARLRIPSTADFSGFSGPVGNWHACALARAVATNDTNFTRTTTFTGSQRQFNNLAQRNMNVV